MTLRQETGMSKKKKPKIPKQRSPVPPPGRIIDDTKYSRRKDKRKLREAIEEQENEEK